MSRFIGQTKLYNSLGKQLERDQVVHLETAANLCASRPDVKLPLKSGNVSHKQIIQENGLIIAKAYQINKGENLNILCLQVPVV